MSTRKPQRTEPCRRPGSVTLGHGAWTRISAVEGIRLSPEAKVRAAGFDRQGLSAAERRAAIIEAHTPKK